MIRRFAALNGSCVSSRRLSCAYLAVCWTNLRFLFCANKAGGCGPLLHVNSADGGVGVGSEFHVSDPSEYDATNSAANEIAGESERITGLLEVATVSAANEIAGESERMTGLLEVRQPSDVGDAAETAAHATAGDSEGIIGLLVSGSSLRMPGRGLGIRQSMGWTKVCATAQSGMWVLEGNVRARMLPDYLGHLRVDG